MKQEILKQVFENKEHAEDQGRAGVKVYPCEAMLGSMAHVREFAAFGLNHKVNLQLIHAQLLFDFCNTQPFTPQELIAFRMGLDGFIKFFENSEEDTKAYLIEAGNKNQQGRKSVG